MAPKGDVVVTEKRVPATFIDRPNRFVARVRLDDGRELPVHVASSGRMAELLLPGAPAVVALQDGRQATAGSPEPGRKTAGRLLMVRTGPTWVSVDTSLPGKLFHRAAARGECPPFAGYTDVRPEYRYGGSRIDFLLTAQGLPPCLVEVKSVTSVLPDADGVRVARFPDAPTDRGARHLRELAGALQHGYRAAVCFVVQRDDAEAFGPWDEIDPVFGETLREVAQVGVEVHALVMRVSPEGAALRGMLPVRLAR